MKDTDIESRIIEAELLEERICELERRLHAAEAEIAQLKAADTKGRNARIRSIIASQVNAYAARHRLVPWRAWGEFFEALRQETGFEATTIARATNVIELDAIEAAGLLEQLHEIVLGAINLKIETRITDRETT